MLIKFRRTIYYYYIIFNRKASIILRNEKISLLLILIGPLLIIALVFPFLWGELTSLSLSLPINSEKFGQFGDFVGGVIGSIWALAGVILFYIALTEQRKDIKTNQKVLALQVDALNQQINEFELQRKELESSRKVYEDQSRTLRVQQFESNFYSLLNVYLTIKNNLNNLDKHGKDYFRTHYETLDSSFNHLLKITDHHDNMIEQYVQLYDEHRGHLSHYFKSFYRIIKIIDSSITLTDREKSFYSKILRSQLTDYEQLLLYYNSHSIYGIKARSLILKYNLLKHTPLFYKPEFAHYYSIQKNFKIVFFTEWFSSFLAKHINESYEITYVADKIEEVSKDFDCIVGIYFEVDSIKIKVICNKDLTQNNIKLSKDEFSNFILCLIHDRLIFSTYLEQDKAIIKKYITEDDDRITFGISVETTAKITLLNDKY
ncbi:putative phage abortive infection protein [Pontibacter sp. FD36]|uniref:putative phage abortive infection protein n=1 Tax=Pontibacter sp. FD36 TaxID=2789860 RepID=UPI0018AB2606|nr:putative phage abortive infection protein [Pontibacter sp. FD36]MBF8965077.1 putative phage abortive infection protein [Pontibacter sp. FD36]